MKKGKNTSPDVVAFIEMNGGKLLDIESSGERLAVFVFEYPDTVSPSDFYSSDFEAFKRARNTVMDRLNEAKALRDVYERNQRQDAIIGLAKKFERGE